MHQKVKNQGTAKHTVQICDYLRQSQEVMLEDNLQVTSVHSVNLYQSIEFNSNLTQPNTAVKRLFLEN